MFGRGKRRKHYLQDIARDHYECGDLVSYRVPCHEPRLATYFSGARQGAGSSSHLILTLDDDKFVYTGDAWISPAWVSPLDKHFTQS